MNNHRKHLAAAVMASLSVVVAAHAADLLSGVRGGMRYDNWWVPAGLPEPQGNHPLYPQTGQQSGSATWRCAECHGWDYKGVSGAYASGPHYTGIPGVLGSTLTAGQMFDLIKNNHAYGQAGMPDQDINDIVEFLQNNLIDTAPFINASAEFVGDEAEGRFGYRGDNGYHTCLHCHGDQPGDIRQLALDDPWQFMHKVRFSDPEAPMSSWLLAGGDDQGAADIGRYVQAGYAGPNYAGDDSCSTCHADSPYPGFFDAYRRSGHPWKIFRTGGETPAPDAWPHTPPPPLPIANGLQLVWSDVEYVIGNYFWKSRFINRNGYIYTGVAGEKTQWNLATQRWVPYSAGAVNKPFDCGVCHTTGYSPVGNQHGLPGLIGTWAQDGVRCEACHGPSSDHVAHPAEMPPPGGQDCAECHYRDPQFRMPWKSGFMEHHQQGEDLAHSPHDRISCVTCHNPHRSTVYDDGGMISQCTDCHPGDASNNHYVVAEMENVACIECHMPFMGKSAESPNANMGDVRGHIFTIMKAPITAAQNTYQVGSSTFWKQNDRGQSFVTLDYACLGCHMQIGEPITMAEASAYANGIHRRIILCRGDADGSRSVNFTDITAILTSWGATGEAYRRGDSDGSGSVNFSDITCVLTNWGATCP